MYIIAITKSMREYTKEERDTQIAAQVDKFSREIYGGNYEYQNMKEILGTVKSHNPNTKFYILQLLFQSRCSVR